MTSAVPDMADHSRVQQRTALRLGGFLGFVGGFMFAYQRSSRKQLRRNQIFCRR